MSGTAKVFAWDANNNLMLQTADGSNHIVFDADNAEIKFKSNNDESTIGVHNTVPEIITTSSETAPTDTNVYSALASDGRYLTSSAIIQTIGSEPSTNNVYSALSSNSLYLKKDSLIGENGTPSIDTAYNSQASENLYFKKSNIISTTGTATINNVYSASASDSQYMLKSNIETTSSSQDSDTKVYSVKAVNAMITGGGGGSVAKRVRMGISTTTGVTVPPQSVATTSEPAITINEEKGNFYIYDLNLYLDTDSTDFDNWHISLTDSDNSSFLGTIHKINPSTTCARFHFITIPSSTYEHKLFITIYNTSSEQFVLRMINPLTSSGDIISISLMQ